VDAVYYALTQENASFKFSTAFEATRRTIHRPWAHVALEGLRRLDEGITPKEAFPEGEQLAHDDEPEDVEEKVHAEQVSAPKSAEPQAVAEETAPLSLMVESSNAKGRSRALVYTAVIVALVLSIAAIGFPAGWYSKRKAVANAPAPATETTTETTAAQNATDAPQPDAATTEEATAEPLSGAAGSAAAQRQQERDARAAALAQERANAQRQNATLPGQPAANNADVKKPEAAAAAAAPQKKTVTVQVTYDENGRVTQASGGDGMAQRIARQKRFPTGKGGTSTVTIPVN
jgi:cytoskeletal protein RodZ